MVSQYKYLWWCWVVLMLYWKKNEFRPIDPIPRVWGGRRGGGGGGRRGESQQLSVMFGHPTLYWASLPYFPTDHKTPNHQKSTLGFVENCIFFFNSFVMFYDSVTKQVRNSFEYSRDSSGLGLSAEFATMYNNLLIS